MSLGKWTISLVSVVGVVALAGGLAAQQNPPEQQNPPYEQDPTWRVPPEASAKVNPLAGKPDAVAGGHKLFVRECVSCHGENGSGVAMLDFSTYIYPPLWGQHSYAVSAGMYRLSKLASFIKSNMPLGATYTAPALTDEEAWDVAAFINSQPHPKKMFVYDWPVISTKPVDYPFGPYADKFSEKQHKYGPYPPMEKKEVAIKK